MSDDLDYLEGISEQMKYSHTQPRNRQQCAASKNYKKASSFLSHEHKKDCNNLRLSAYQPSLPKLKFLEGKE